MHMALVHRLMADASLPDPDRQMLQRQWGSFLLGSIAPDARVSSGLNRADTHFFEYRPVIDPPPAAVMLRHYPELRRESINGDAARAAFVAGYAGHLAMDEIWCTDLLFPQLILAEDWGTPTERNIMLHMLLGYMDHRDRAQLPDTDYQPLAAAEPHGWLPFMSDAALLGWRDTVAPQLAPDGTSLTLDILGRRINMAAPDMAAFINNHAQMAVSLWAHISHEALASVEEAMYNAVRSTIIGYLDDFEKQGA